MKNITPHRKKKFVPTAFKFMVAVSSLAGTVGIWNFLSNKDLLQANAQNINVTPTTDSFAPLPTVVPLISVNLSSATQTTFSESAAPRAVTITNTASNQPALAAGPSSSSTIIMPSPITNTASSKK